MKSVIKKKFRFLLNEGLYWSKASQTLLKSTQNLLYCFVAELRFKGSRKRRNFGYTSNGQISYSEREFKHIGLGSSQTFLKATREIDSQNTKYHLHCLRHTFAVRHYLQIREIYRVEQKLGHNSVVTMEIYTKFSLRRLKADFPLLVNSTKSTQIWEKGHTLERHTSNRFSLSSIIYRIRTSQ